MKKLALVLLLLAGCKPSVNICDGQPHQVGDIAIKFEETSVADGKLIIRTAITNKSIGHVFMPTYDLDVTDNFNNTIDLPEPPLRKVGTDETESATYHGKVRSKPANKFFVKLRVCTGKTPGGVAIMQDLRGSFATETSTD